MPNRLRTDTILGACVLLALAAACSPRQPAPGESGDDATPPAAAAARTGSAAGDAVIPPGATEAAARLAASPRHAEWVTVPTGGADSVRAWVVYPERADPAPVVLVVHEIFGLSHWIRAVADRLAADGFIAIAPDLLTMQNIPQAEDGAPDADAARAAIRGLQPADVHRQLRAAAEYGMSLPAALPRYAITGFCWGGQVAFQHLAESPAARTAVVYYGTSPDTESLGRIRVPVLGLYGEDDARVNATIAPAESALRALGRTYETRVYDGAGHGFLRAQDGRDGANLRAAQHAWPLTVEWMRRELEGAGTG